MDFTITPTVLSHTHAKTRLHEKTTSRKNEGKQGGRFFAACAKCHGVDFCCMCQILCQNDNPPPPGKCLLAPKVAPAGEGVGFAGKHLKSLPTHRTTLLHVNDQPVDH